MSVSTPAVLLAFQAAMKEHRKAAGLTHKQMGEVLGVSRQQVGHTESLRDVPTLVTADRVASFFGKSLADFLHSGNVTLAQSSGSD